MSKLEQQFEATLLLLKFPQWEREYIFHPTRKWRLDFAWPEKKIAVEIEGGTFVKGAHTRGKHFHSDCIKYGEAAILGWRVLRVDTIMVRDGTAMQMLERLLDS